MAKAGTQGQNTRRCYAHTAAGRCVRDAVSETANVLCTAHHMVVLGGNEVKLVPEATEVERAALREMQRRLTPEQVRWRAAIATAGFASLTLLVEVTERSHLNVPAPAPGLSLDNLDIALDNAIPVLLMLSVTWAALMVLALNASLVGFLLSNVARTFVFLPITMLRAARIALQGTRWTLAASNPLHGLIQHDKGLLWKAGHLPATPDIDLGIAHLKTRAAVVDKDVVAEMEFLRAGAYLIPNWAHTMAFRFFKRGRYLLVFLCIAVTSAVGVWGITYVRLLDAEARIASHTPCGTTEAAGPQELLQWLAEPFRIKLTCGHIVVDDRYPGAASGLGYDPDFVRIGTAAKVTSGQFRSSEVIYVKNFGPWAVVSVPQRTGDRDGPKLVSIDRARVTEFIVADASDRANDDSKAAYFVAARTPDSWQKTEKELQKQIKTLAAQRAELQTSVKALNGANAKLSEQMETLNARNRTLHAWIYHTAARAQPPQQDVTVVLNADRPAAACPIVRQACQPQGITAPPDLSALEAAMRNLQTRFDDLQSEVRKPRDPISLAFLMDTRPLAQATEATNTVLSEMRDRIEEGLKALDKPRTAPDRTIAVDLNLAQGWSFSDTFVVNEPADPPARGLVQTIFENCEPMVAVTFPADTWALDGGEWHNPDHETSNPAHLDAWIAADTAPILSAFENTEQVFVIGSADQTGRSSANLDLSRKRARALGQWITQWGVPNEAITTLAVGDMNFLESRILRAQEADKLQRSARSYACPSDRELFAQN